MPAGNDFSVWEMERIERAVRNAESFSGLKFSVYVGATEEDSRAYAERLHSALEDSQHSVLIMCDPGFRALEVVTGAEARRLLGDAECALAVAAMQTSFVSDDIVGGLTVGIQQLGSAARAPKMLHTKPQTHHLV